MILRKVIPERTEEYEVKFFPHIFNMTWGKFKEIRQRYGMKYNQWEKCFCCGKPFKDCDVPCPITVSGKGNLFACAICAQEGGKQDG